MDHGLDFAHGRDEDLERMPSIPVDDDGNYIADCWDYNDGDAIDDAEALPGMGDPNYPGDGLSRYEEYRGFMALGQHIRTNPDDDKDLFISDRDDIHGINGNWGDVTASGVTPHGILEEEYRPPVEALTDPEFASPSEGGRMINFNNHFALHARHQFAIKMIDGQYDENEFGGSWFYSEDDYGPPMLCVLIRIYTETIREAFGDDPSRQLWEQEDLEALSHTIGHEVGHAMCLIGDGPGHRQPGPDPMCVMYSPFGPENLGHHYCEERCLGFWALYNGAEE